MAGKGEAQLHFLSQSFLRDKRLTLLNFVCVIIYILRYMHFWTNFVQEEVLKY